MPLRRGWCIPLFGNCSSVRACPCSPLCRIAVLTSLSSCSGIHIPTSDGPCRICIDNNSIRSTNYLSLVGCSRLMVFCLDTMVQSTASGNYRPRWSGGVVLVRGSQMITAGVRQVIVCVHTLPPIPLGSFARHDLACYHPYTLWVSYNS
jgi:hypothetical protein